MTPTDYYEIRRIARDAVIAALPSDGMFWWHPDPANDGSDPVFYISDPLDVFLTWDGERYGGTFILEAKEVDARGYTDRDLVDLFEIQLSHRVSREISKASKKSSKKA